MIRRQRRSTLCPSPTLFRSWRRWRRSAPWSPRPWRAWKAPRSPRSEEHTSELRSRRHLVCRLLLAKKYEQLSHERGLRSGGVHLLRVGYRGAAAEGGDVVFFFNDTATTEIYTLSLHDALSI